MKRFAKKIVSILLAIMMIVSLFAIVPMSVGAATTSSDVLTMGFETTDPRTDWSFGAWSASSGNITVYNRTLSARTGSYYGSLNTSNTNSRTLTSPVFDLSGATSATVSFYYANGSNTSGQLRAYLVYGENEVSLLSTSSRHTSWTSVSQTINFSSESPAPKEAYLVFAPASNVTSNSNVILDNIKVTKTTTTYTVTLDAQGGTGGTASVEASNGFPMPEITVPTRAGYTFNGYFYGTYFTTQYYTSEGQSARNWNRTSNTTLNATWTVIPAVAPTVNVAEDEINCVYDDIDAAAEVEATADADAEYTLTYQWYEADETPIDEATDSSYDIPSDLEPGSYGYYCVVTATRQDNNETASTTSDVITVNVDKATPVLTITPAEDLVYNTEDQALLVDGQTSGPAQDLVYNLDGGEYGSEIPTAKNAGTYVVGFKSVESDHYYGVEEDTVTVEIEKAVPEYTVPENLTATYGDTLADVDLSAYPGWVWVSSDTTPVGDAGERSFSAKFTPEDTANYKTVTEQVKINVKKAALTVTANNQTVLYGDAVKQDQYTVTGLVGDDMVDVTLAYAISTNTIKPVVTASNNYTVKTVNGILTIKLSPIANAQTSGKNLNVKWSTVKNADGYIIYAGYCGSGDYPAVKTIADNATTSATITKLGGKAIDTKKNIFLYVVAYKNVDGKKVTLVRSASMRAAGSANPKFTNAKKVTVAKSSATLKVGGTMKAGATVTLVNTGKKLFTDYPKISYASSNKSVAAVDGNGKITAVSAGTANIYAYTQNGVKAKIAVTVE